MFSWLANAWRVPELRRRLLFTAAVLAAYRLGSWMPAPGVDSALIGKSLGSGMREFKDSVSGSSRRDDHTELPVGTQDQDHLNSTAPAPARDHEPVS